MNLELLVVNDLAIVGDGAVGVMKKYPTQGMSEVFLVICPWRDSNPYLRFRRYRVLSIELQRHSRKIGEFLC